METAQMSSETAQKRLTSGSPVSLWHQAHEQSPQQSLICVMRPAIFTLHLFTGNSSLVDTAGARASTSEPDTVWKARLVHSQEVTVSNETLQRHRQWPQNKTEGSPDHESLPLVYSAVADPLKKPTERDCNEFHGPDTIFFLSVWLNKI